jgi:hypothetical protein
VDWRACVDPQGNNYQVSGRHLGLVVNREAFAQKGPVVIDCPMDYSENLTLTEKLRKVDSYGKPRACSENLFLEITT